MKINLTQHQINVILSSLKAREESFFENDDTVGAEMCNEVYKVIREQIKKN